jgi:hypothetical protein
VRIVPAEESSAQLGGMVRNFVLGDPCGAALK